MTQQVQNWISGSFYHDTTSVCTVTIGGTPHNITTAIGYYRTWLAPTGGAGTSYSAPKEYLAYLKAGIEAAFAGVTATLRMSTAGRIQMTTTGGGSWSVVWDGTGATDKKTRNVLGWDVNIGTTAAGTYATAANPPMYCVSSLGKQKDTYWQGRQQIAADFVPETGVGYVIQSGAVGQVRSFDATHLPTDTSAATLTWGLATCAHPAYPGGDRFITPVTVPTISMPTVYSWHDFVHTMGGHELGAAIGTDDYNTGVLTSFVNVQAATTTRFDKCYLHPDFVGELRTVRPSDGYHKLYNVLGVKLTFVSQATLA